MGKPLRFEQIESPAPMMGGMQIQSAGHSVPSTQVVVHIVPMGRPGIIDRQLSPPEHSALVVHVAPQASPAGSPHVPSAPQI